MLIKKGIAATICGGLFLFGNIFCQSTKHTDYIKLISNKINSFGSHEYNISGLDVDEAIHDPTLARCEIEDPYHTLLGCIIFLVEGKADTNLVGPKGFIGIYRKETDSILWKSEELTQEFTSGPLGGVLQTTELNKDGKVEIIIGQAFGPHAEMEALWIFSWDGINGELITERDEGGESVLCDIGDTYELVDVDGDGVSEIKAMWYKDEDSEETKIICYSWNGHLYGSWGKSSKYFLEGK